MKFLSVSLHNYIGIYNGMGLYNISIDLTLGKNRIILIRGDNGSGKSTLSEAINVFPENNSSFIPGLPAKKELSLLDGDIIYKLVFIHDIKEGGARESVKAYISKIINGGVAIELNPNGNLSSYRSILYDELSLDPNFVALSQLSTHDRGLADKKPADRKKFVNAILTSLDTYNNINKTLTKRSTSYKSMINSIVAKLNIIGDEKVIDTNLKSINNQINALENIKNNAIIGISKAQSTISILDPDGFIQQRNNKLTSDLIQLENDIASIDSIVTSLTHSNSINNHDYKKDLESIIKNKNELIVQNQIAKNDLESLISRKEREAASLEEKTTKLYELQNNFAFEAVKKKAKDYEEEMTSICNTFKDIGIYNIDDLSGDEYVLALETFKDLEEHISDFKSYTDMVIIDLIVSYFIENGVVPNHEDTKESVELLNKLKNEYDLLYKEKTNLESNMNLLDKLALRPSNCKIDTCNFIKDAISFSTTQPKERYMTICDTMAKIEDDMTRLNMQIKRSSDINDAINRFSVIAREANKNASILSKMPNGEMFKDKTLFFSNLLCGYSFDYMKTIYSYINYSNLIDTYKNIKTNYQKCVMSLAEYESKTVIIDSIIADIEKINTELSGVVSTIQRINQEVSKRDISIVQLQELEGVYTAILEQLRNRELKQSELTKCNELISENNIKMNSIQKSITEELMYTEELNKAIASLEPLNKERDKLNHSMEMLKDYTEELAELKYNYEFIETIRYYSSPTTGIQLIFMDLYMGKIIELANELLSLLFSGQFVIQPFIINDSEFRIPCLGSGYINDDISSMSGSQIGMISMILSFALLHHSSTKYNIIKLDEIDAPLDYSNRAHFYDVLNSIMDIMGTEQCIMISHNTELQANGADVILLKQEEKINYEDFRNNIIWSYPL